MTSKTAKAKSKPADYVTEKAGFAEVELSRPRVIDGTETAVLRMREPTVDDMTAYQESRDSEAKREAAMIANLCEISPEALGQFPLRDYSRLQAAFVLFTN